MPHQSPPAVVVVVDPWDCYSVTVPWQSYHEVPRTMSPFGVDVMLKLLLLLLQEIVFVVVVIVMISPLPLSAVVVSPSLPSAS